MNTKNNQRFQDSEEKMQRALFNLLRNETAQDVTVWDIGKEAEVNRTTFYTHFSDIRELTEKCEMKIRRTILRAFHEKNSEPQNRQKWQLFFLYSMKEYRKFFSLYFQYHKNGTTQDGSSQIWLSSMPSQLDNYRRAFYRAGVEAILMQWVEDSCVDSPETVQTVLSQHLSKNFL